MEFTDLPLVNACLNGCSAILLILGYRKIKQGDREGHRKFMMAALTSTGLFLCCYLTYHYNVGSVPYRYHDWTRILYFVILIPHVILAAVQAPFIIVAVRAALKGNEIRHKKIMRYIFPVWMYVSVTGIMVYLMLYQL